MRVISFQDRVVLEIILKDGVYFADASKCREKRDYRLDRESLGGKLPIWVYMNPGINFNLLRSGEVIERWRCEMSLDQKVGLTQFAMLELEIPENNIMVGKTHNAYKYAGVIDRIDKKLLCAIYRVEHTGHWFYKRIVPERFFVKDPCIPEILDTRALKFYGLYDEITSDDDCRTKCAYCDSRTGHRSGNLFVCSRYCEDHIIRLYKKYYAEKHCFRDTIFNELMREDVYNMRTERMPKLTGISEKMSIF